MILKRFSKILITVFISAIFGILALDFWVGSFGNGRIYHQIDETPARRTGLVLGTSKYIGRTLNLYYSYRIESALKLYQQNKVDILLLSGDNAHRSYNEPWTMRQDMLKAGVPEQHIVLDYAGFRTLDSVVRAKKVFDADKFTLVTQAFHCDRALFIADHANIDAICFAVPSPEGNANYKLRFREIFARVKAVLDIYILNEQPKYLGPKEKITLINERVSSIDVNDNG